MVSSCKKYEEGPSFSLRTKTGRLSRTWKVFSIIDDSDSNNENELLDGEKWEYTFNKNLTFSVYRLYYDVNNNLVQYQSGQRYWNFSDDKKYIILDYDETGNGTEANGDIVKWEIERLTKNDLWVKEVTEDNETLNITMESLD